MGKMPPVIYHHRTVCINVPCAVNKNKEILGDPINNFLSDNLFCLRTKCHCPLIFSWLVHVSVDNHVTLCRVLWYGHWLLGLIIVLLGDNVTGSWYNRIVFLYTISVVKRVKDREVNGLCPWSLGCTYV